jgi:hypothetical protein
MAFVHSDLLLRVFHYLSMVSDRFSDRVLCVVRYRVDLHWLMAGMAVLSLDPRVSVGGRW